MTFRSAYGLLVRGAPSSPDGEAQAGIPAKIHWRRERNEGL